MNKKLKILLIVPWYPNPNDKENPSRGSFFKEQFNNLCMTVDITVLIINIHYINSSFSFKNFWSLKKRDNKNFSLYELNIFYIPKLLKFTSKYVAFFLSKSKISTIIENIDIIHSHVIFPSGAIGFELAEKFQKPFILTEHISTFPTLIKNKYLHKILLNADYLTAVSSYLKDRILAEGRSQCEVIPNYIDTTKYYISSNKDTKRLQFIHISSMADIKNVDKLLLGFKLFIEKNDINCKLLLLGGGANVLKYKNFSKELGIENVIEFKGDVSNDVLRESLSNSHALLITSIVETFSVVGIEALASGVCVITTKCGGPEDYIEENVTGIYIESLNVNHISNALSKYICNQKQCNPLKIKQWTYDKFDQSIIVDKLENLYKIMLNYGK